jgi:hypothetical protein
MPKIRERSAGGGHWRHSDVWQQIEVFGVFVRAAFPFSDLLFGLNELDRDADDPSGSTGRCESTS